MIFKKDIEASEDWLNIPNVLMILRQWPACVYRCKN